MSIMVSFFSMTVDIHQTSNLLEVNLVSFDLWRILMDMIFLLVTIQLKDNF